MVQAILVLLIGIPATAMARGMGRGAWLRREVGPTQSVGLWLPAAPADTETRFLPYCSGK